MQEKIQGTKAIAQRMINAENNFIALVMERGFSKVEAEKVLRVYRKARFVTMDAVLGRITVKHGSYWELDVLRNAVAYNG